MITFIEVRCPHCAEKTHVVLPQAGALFAGPCLKCSKHLAVAMGTAYPLDDQVMTEGTAEEKHNHIMFTLAGYLDEQVAGMVGYTPPSH